MADNARGIHVSAGVYSREIELNYAVKSLGITTLGLVGETQRGPAFQPMSIQNWREFQDVFGGTSTEKFVASQYPKYELPYIAKSYLSESNQLEVCRVLGLSGYNAGPAWLITAPTKDNKEMIVAVLRSRAYYEKYVSHSSSNDDECSCNANEYDKLTFDVGEVTFDGNDGYCKYPKHSWGDALQLKAYYPFDSSYNCNEFKFTQGKGNEFNVQSSDYGHFKIVGIATRIESTDAVKDLADKIGEGKEALKNSPYSGYADFYFEYSVSLNPADKDYILKVLGTNAHDGNAPIYVESLYDVSYQQMVDGSEISTLNQQMTFLDNYNLKDFCQLKPVNGFVEKKEEELSRKDVGKRFLCKEDDYTTCHLYDYSGGTFEIEGDSVKSENTKHGEIYTVRQYTDKSRNRHYYYAKIDTATTSIFSGTTSGQSMNIANDVLVTCKEDMYSVSENRIAVVVKNLDDGFYYRLTEDKDEQVSRVYCDVNNYKSSYRFASTPWIVSNLKGDYETAELSKLFRFHTISDGNSSNNEIKISIANIRPDEGTFDVIVRHINDTDASIVKLESFSRCNLVPGSPNYIGYKIGTYDGAYEVKSKYITVEINENLTTKNSVPAGFIGYPLPKYNSTQIYEPTKEKDKLTVNTNDPINTEKLVRPIIAYNTEFDEDIKHKRQYFGLSDIKGVDIDLFTFKGIAAYPANADDEPVYLTPGFHLDSRISEIQEQKKNLSVEGVTGYEFETVSTLSVTDNYDGIPLIGKENEMDGSIFEYVDLRKFTVYFYGGFDGWDEYRDSRSNTDDFKMTKYRGEYSKTSGEGYAFNKLRNPELYNINEADANTSDYYAYLSAIRQFANPESIDINVFATPGIDIINNRLLTEEAIDMIEEERADSIYIATMPDKPFGASDYVDEMYTPDDIIDELLDSAIDSNYTCTYYPWVKYYDEDNYQYINLPVTKDVVRNMALTDNTTHPWYAPAGISRGDVSCEHAHYVTTLADEDVLYDGRVNPVKTFANDGVKLWGQKNLQVNESQLNRINVRRLLLRMRKLIAIACRNLIFEPNDNTTKASFLSTVTPILDNIKANRGISDYKIEVNDTVESRERRELPAKIYFKVINSLEYISLDFILTPEGVSFDNI